MKFGSIVCSLLLVMSTAVFAQGTLEGVILDARTDQPLPNANITLGNTGASSDANGHYRVENIVAGSHEVTVSFVGYKTSIQNVNLTSGTVILDIRLQPTIIQGQSVTVSASRATERETPVTFTNIDRGHIERTMTTADVPTVLSEVPGVHTWSDAGNNVGYTYLSVRGFTQERVAVMVNGIPQNDPETHQVYWVNMPDLMESVEDIQVQRGVGSSEYGASAIGGILNLVTGTFNQRRGMTVTGVTGSYNTRKFSAEYNSGLIGDGYQMYGRLSRITSDGYRDQAWSKLWSYYFGVIKNIKNSRLQFNLFGGSEQTHFAFYGATREQLQANRKANPFSTYQGATDNFSEPHYQLIHEWTPSDEVEVSNRLFYKKGDGYYNDLDWVNPNNVRQDHLDIQHFGWLPRVEFEHPFGRLSVGGELRRHRTRHWGLVLGGDTETHGETMTSQRLYDYLARKVTYGFYLHELWQPVERLSIMADLSIRGHQFRIGDDQVVAAESIEDFSYNFVMPRFGVNYNLTEELNVFGNFSVGRREPSLTNIFDPAAFFGDPDRQQGFENYNASGNTVSDPRLNAEKLNDWEFGVGYARNWIAAKVNAYVMDFRDEIVATGTVLGTGVFDHQNAAETTHKGLELSATVRPLSAWTLSGNAMLSSNTFDAFGSTNYDGNDIPNFPDKMVNLRVSCQQAGFWGSLWLRHVGGYYYDIPNTAGHEVDAYTTVNARLSYRFDRVLGAQVIEPGISINNLLNAKYDSWGALFYGMPTWTPAATRNVMLSIKVIL